LKAEQKVDYSVDQRVDLMVEMKVEHSAVYWVGQMADLMAQQTA
jgi:hypothetical protein